MRNLSPFSLFAASLLATSSLVASSSCDSACKAYPGTESWPSKQQWSKLNETTDGRLIKPVAPGGVCHKGQPNYNPDKEVCLKLQKEDWPSYDWHGDDPVSVMWDNFANYTCLPDAKAPCSLSGYPAYVVNATTAEHVKAGVDFARENNVRLIVKASGHDFHGRSIAPGSLSIYVHHMSEIEYHEGEFKLAGDKTVIDGDAVSCGGGTEMYDLYKATAKHGTTVVGGMAKSVSVGGYLTGGGHSLLAPDHGLAVDNVLEIEIVTPDGEILTVNEDQNEDLFWALRGGGGSTFGVITSFTLKTHPTPKVQNSLAIMSTYPDNPRAPELLSFLASQVPSLMESGLRGYGWMALNASDPLSEDPTRWAGLAGSFSLMDQESGAMEKLFSDLNDTLTEKFDGKASVMLMPVQSYDTWLDFFEVSFDAGSAGASTLMVSRLIGEDALTGDSEAFQDALKAALEPNELFAFYPLGGKGVIDAKPRGGSNSVNPGWRKALVHSLSTMSPKSFNQTSEREIKKILDESYEPLRKITPGMGAYLNEAAAFEKDPATTFWGDNYKRLLKIKRDVDPGDVFWCEPCVGNERWEQNEDGQLCKIDVHNMPELRM